MLSNTFNNLEKEFANYKKAMESEINRLQEQINELTWHWDFYAGGKVDFYNGLNVVVGAAYDNKLVWKLYYSIGAEVELNKLNVEAKALIHYRF
jgi:hypothetical protein